MHQLINKQTGEAVPVSHDELEGSLSSGQYSMPGDQPVALKGPDGELVEVDPQFVYQAVSQGGFAFPSEQEHSKALNQAKYGDGAANHAKALLYGAIEGVPFAGGGMLSNIATQEEVAGLKDAHPVLNAVGQIGTTLAGVLVAPQAEGVAAARAALTEAKALGNIEAIALAAKNLAQAQSAFTGLDILNPISALTKAGQKAAQLVPEGLSATSKALSKIGQAATQGAVEGSLFTAGQLANEYTLGNPNFNGENLLHNVGIGAVLGGVFGGTLETALIGGKGAVSKLWGKAEDATTKELTHIGTQEAAEKLSLQAADEKAMVGVGGAFDESTAEKAIVADAMKNPNVIVDPPILPAQLEQFSSPESKAIYQGMRESNEEVGKEIVAREQLQKKSILKSITGIVDSISDAPATKTIEQAGKRAVKTVEDVYESVQAELKPFWKKMSERGKTSVIHPGEAIDYIEKAIPGISDHMDFDGIGGLVKLNKWEAGLPWKRDTHKAIQDVLNIVNQENLTLGNVANLRSNLYELATKFDTGTQARGEIDQVRKQLLDFMQNVAGDDSIRENLRKYAKNEQFRDTMEYVLGGSLRAGNNLKKAISPEDALKKIFSDSPTVARVRQELGEAKFNELLKDYLHHEMQSAYDPATGNFLSNKMKKLLSDYGGKGIELTEAFGGNQSKLKDLRDYNALLRNIPDAPSSNPSHTAKQKGFNDRIKDVATSALFLLSPQTEIARVGFEKIGQALGSKADDLVSRRTLFNMEKGMDAVAARKEAERTLMRYRVLERIEKARDVTNKKIESGVKNILSGAELAKKSSGKAAELVVTGVDRGKNVAVKDDYEKKSNKIRIMAQNPEQTMTGLADATEALHEFAPQTATAFHTTIAKGVQFLDSKIPMSPGHYPMGSEFTPSKAEMQTFLSYYDMVESPLKVMDKIKLGLLTPNDMEVMSSVHQETYQKIQKQILLSHDPKQKVSYQTKMMLSLFMGQPMDGSLTQESILTNQLAIAGPSQQDQGMMPQATPARADKLDVAGRSMTPMQRANNRGGE